MQKSVSLKSRVGFTIVELLVVIGILGILLVALLPMVGGSRDSALTAKCKNNMKNLALGVLTYAQATGTEDNMHGHFPAAGYYRSIALTRKKSYYPHPSWISNKGDLAMLNRSTGSVYLGDVAHFTESEDDVRNAITNGAIWQSSGAAFEVYRCPVHAREYEKQHDGRLPGWSYMMNQEFGYNRDNQGSIAFFGSSIKSAITVSVNNDGTRKKSASRGHDKVLLFSEIQGIEVNDSRHGVSLKPVTGGGLESDAVLEYTKESMGFNHPIGKKRYGGNVAFADAHVDTITMPTESGYIRDLTRYLCQGFAVPHDGSRYTPSDIDK